MGRCIDMGSRMGVEGDLLLPETVLFQGTALKQDRLLRTGIDGHLFINRLGQIDDLRPDSTRR